MAPANQRGRLLEATEQLLDDVRRDVARARPEHAYRAAVNALASCALARPAHVRLLLSDSLACARELRDVRDGLIDELARIVDAAHAQLPPDAAVADLPSRLVLGAASRLLAARLSQSEEPLGDAPHHDIADLTDVLERWTAMYELPIADHRWCALGALAAPSRSPYLPPTALRAPPPLAPGSPRTSSAAVVENHWLRIVFATAEVIERDGYESATVAQITAAAGVDTPAFYSLFAGRQEAFAAINELLFGHAMAVAAGAFVAGSTWPERVWEAARAVTQYAEQNRTLTYVSLVEGDAAVAPAEQLTRAFTIFLLEGTRDARERPAGEAVLEVAGAAAHELCYRHVRDGDRDASGEPLALAQLLYLALTPALGAQAANEFLARRMAPRHARAAHRSTLRPARYQRTAPDICS